MIIVKLLPSPKKEKKMVAIINNNGKVNNVHFGAKGYSDFTIHKDKERMERYIARHKGSGTQDWTKKGINTAGFWSRWILWSKPSLKDAILFTSKKFNIKIENKN